MAGGSRAMAAALEADDPDVVAAASWNLGMILSAKGYIDEVRGVVQHALDDLRPHMDRPTEQRLAVWGGLHLLGATEAARDDRDAEAWRMLDVAEKVAARTGETNHHRLVFGPTNVAVHRVSVSVELGRTQEALDLAERVAIDAAPAVERRLTHRLDVARSYTRKRNDLAAMHMIQHIHRESPEELVHSVLAREVLRELMGRAQTSMTGELRPLLQAAHLPH